MSATTIRWFPLRLRLCPGCGRGGAVAWSRALSDDGLEERVEYRCDTAEGGCGHGWTPVRPGGLVRQIRAGGRPGKR